MNYLEALNRGNKILKESNIISYSIDSELLLAKVLNSSREKILINLNKEITKKKYLNNKSNLKESDPLKFKEINDRFILHYWRVIIVLCDYQMKYRYYFKAINAIKDKSYPDMNSNDFFELFDKK